MKFLEVVESLKVNVEDFAQVNAICLGRAYAVQSAFDAKVLSNKSVKVNFKKLSIAIDTNEYKIQCLGSKTLNNKWVWAWAEDTSSIPALFSFANQIKEFGEKHEALYAKTPYYDEPHNEFCRCLMSVTTAILDTCYVQCNNDKGIMYLAVTDAPSDIYDVVNAKQFAQITKHALDHFPIDHKLFIEGFCLFYDIAYTIEDDKIMVVLEKDILIELNKEADSFKVKNLRII